MKTLSLLALLGLTAFSAPSFADGISSKTCAPDAIEQSEKLLRFHNGYSAGQPIENHTVPTMEDVKALPKVPAVGGRHFLQVLQVSSGIYKADYTMTFKFAEIPDRNNPTGVACILMGQSITEESNPF